MPPELGGGQPSSGFALVEIARALNSDALQRGRELGLYEYFARLVAEKNPFAVRESGQQSVAPAGPPRADDTGSQGLRDTVRYREPAGGEFDRRI